MGKNKKGKQPKEKLLLFCEEKLDDFRRNYWNFTANEDNMLSDLLTYRYEFKEDVAAATWRKIDKALERSGYQEGADIDNRALDIMMNVIKDVWYTEASGGKWSPPHTLHEYRLPQEDDFTSPEWHNVNHRNH